MSQRFDELEKLKGYFCDDSVLLREIVDGMDSAEFHEIFEHICAMHDIPED